MECSHVTVWKPMGVWMRNGVSSNCVRPLASMPSQVVLLTGTLILFNIDFFFLVECHRVMLLIWSLPIASNKHPLFHIPGSIDILILIYAYIKIFTFIYDVMRLNVCMQQS